VPSASHTACYQVSIDALYEAMSDYEAYPEFLGHFQRIEVLEEYEDNIRIHVEGDLMGKVRYVIDVEWEPPVYLAWEYIEGEGFHHLRGVIEMEELDDGHVEVFHELDVKPRVAVPGFVVKQFLKQNVPSVLHTFYQRALYLEGR